MLAVLAPGQGSQKPGFLDSMARARRRRGPPALVVRAVAAWTWSTSAPRPTPTRSRTPRRPSRCWSPRPCSPPSSCRCTTSPSPPGTASASSPRPRSPVSSRPRSRDRPSPGSAAARWPPPARSSRPACPPSSAATPTEVLAAIDDAGLYPANRNGAGQIVAAGSIAGLDKLAAAPPAKARVIPLQVAGAFHTPYMAPAEQALAAVAGGIIRRAADQDPALQPRRRRRRPRPDHAAPPGQPGHRAGALGPVHGRPSPTSG